VSQDDRPESDAEQPQARPRKDEDRNHADVVEQHYRDQSFRGTPRCVYAREPVRNAKGKQRLYSRH
jgi:hypothetical protein